MNVDSILISEYATLTPGNQLTVIRAFNSLAAPKFPATHRWLAISLVIHAHRDERGSTHQIEIRVTKPEGTESLHRGEFTLADGEPPPGMPLRHTYIHQQLGFVFEAEGAYAFEVYVDDTYHAASTLYIHHKPT